MLDSVLRRLGRDHWVRLHGTPRVTVLVGGERGRELWAAWLALANAAGTLLDGSSGGSSGGSFDERIREAVASATREPAHPIAVLVAPEDAARWRAGRSDRLAALVDEGWIAVPDEPAPDRARARALDARSVAEAALYEALEATPATAGRFQLNASLAVRFGPAAAEVDLLSRGDRIAIEIDGVHHFADPDCYRRDRRKDLMLQTQGFIVVRWLAEDVMRDVRAAVNAVCQVLAYRLAEPGR